MTPKPLKGLFELEIHWIKLVQQKCAWCDQIFTLQLHLLCLGLKYRLTQLCQSICWLGVQIQDLVVHCGIEGHNQPYINLY